jgi:P27 family predicted phage terminase small subunit
MRGRKPKPLAQRIAEGDAQKVGKKKLQEQLAREPKAMVGYPPCPSHLSGLAKKTWTFLVEQLEFMDQDRKPDAVMLEGACVNYARAVAADKILERDGITFEQSTIDQETGERIILNIRPRPEISISNAAWLRVRAFCSEFGLSPVSRTRLATAPDAGKKDEEEIRNLLSAPREKRKELVQ